MPPGDDGLRLGVLRATPREYANIQAAFLERIARLVDELDTVREPEDTVLGCGQVVTDREFAGQARLAAAGGRHEADGAGTIGPLLLRVCNRAQLVVAERLGGGERGAHAERLSSKSPNGCVPRSIASRIFRFSSRSLHGG